MCAGFVLFLSLMIDRLHHYIRELRLLRKTMEAVKKQSRSFEDGKNGSAEEHKALTEEIATLRTKIKKLESECEVEGSKAKALETEVEALIHKLINSSAYVKISYSDPRTDMPMSYDRCRIKKLEDHCIDLFVMTKLAMQHIKKIPLENIICIKLVTATNNIIIDNKKLTRFDILDIAEAETTEEE